MANITKKSVFLSSTIEEQLAQLEMKKREIYANAEKEMKKRATTLDVLMSKVQKLLTEEINEHGASAVLHALSVYLDKGTTNPSIVAQDRTRMTEETKTKLTLSLQANAKLPEKITKDGKEIKNPDRKTVAQFAEEFGISAPTVQNLKKDLGLSKVLVAAPTVAA